MERHFTATAYIFHEEKVLLHFHSKLKKWLPPGGHIEPNETPPEAAIREAKEETGLDIILIEEDPIKIKTDLCVNFPRPFLCLLESIPKQGNTAPHEHMDFIYIAKLASSSDASSKTKEFHWFTYQELSSIAEDLFADTKQILTLLKKRSSEDASPLTGCGAEPHKTL